MIPSAQKQENTREKKMNVYPMKSIRVLIVLLSAGIFCSFSAGLKKPAITYEKYVVKKVTLRDTKVDFVYSVDNPNPVGLKRISADYEMYLGYSEKPKNTPPFGVGKDVKFDVKAKALSPFVLPMTINYEGFFKSASKLAKAVLGGQKTVPFVLETTFTLNLKILKFRIPVEARGELPLPEAKDVRKMILK
jgi:LEA14-like dessication related protein